MSAYRQARPSFGLALPGIDLPILVLFLLLLLFIGYPLVMALDVLSLDAIRRLFSPSTVEPLLNSILVAALTAGFSAAIAIPLAWLCARTDLPTRHVIGPLVAISFVVPVLLACIAYVFLFGRNAGLINKAFNSAFSVPLFNVYSFAGIVFVAVLHSYPLVFFTTYSSLRKANPELEEAGRICGLSQFAIFRHITLGSMLPAILAGTGFVVAEALTMLAPPLVLGLPVGLRFMTTELYATIVTNPDLAMAAAMSLPLVLITLAVLLAEGFLIRGSSARFATVSGKGAHWNEIKLGKWKWLLVVLAWIPIVLSLILPAGTLLITAFMGRWWRGLQWDNMTIGNFAFLYNDPSVRLALWNSIVLSIGVGIAVTIFGILLALVISGNQTAVKRFIRYLASLPLGIPHVVAGVLIILAWYGNPFHLGGTLWILALGYLLVMLPYGVRTGEVACGQIDGSLGEAARIGGCSQVQTWQYVLLPLMQTHMFTIFIMVFLFVVKEFSFTAMLYNAQTQTLAVRIYAYLEGGSLEKTAASATLLLAITFLTLFLATRIFRASLSSMRI